MRPRADLSAPSGDRSEALQAQKSQARLGPRRSTLWRVAPEMWRKHFIKDVMIYSQPLIQTGSRRSGRWWRRMGRCRSDPPRSAATCSTTRCSGALGGRTGTPRTARKRPRQAGFSRLCRWLDETGASHQTHRSPDLGHACDADHRRDPETPRGSGPGRVPRQSAALVEWRSYLSATHRTGRRGSFADQLSLLSFAVDRACDSA